MTNKDTVVAGMYLDLIKVQSEIEAVDKDATNPFFNSGYATLGATINACKQILNKHNFVVIQPIESDENGVYVCTTLIHSSGGKIKSRMRINQKEANNPQAQGSAVTYARRYSLQAILCMNAEDDDANTATHTPQTTKVFPSTDKQKKMIFALGKQKGIEDVEEKIKTFFKLDSFTELTSQQASKAIENLQKQPDVNQT